MKISQEEIDAANYALGELMEAPLDEAVMEHALIAALKVRRARKQAKRERQRKEKDKQVVESVKPASVAAFLKDGETVLDRLQRGQRDEVMLMKLLAEEKLKNEALTKMNADQIKHMTERFLGWKLPENFHPDGGITFKATFNENTPPMKAEPVGTNLFDYSQAKAMVEYMIEGLPISSATPSKAPEWDGNASAFDAAMKPKA